MAEATTMVLKVDLQCDRCYKKVKKVLCKFPEVRDQKYDEKANTVTISVVSSNPESIKNKICSKAGCCIKSIEIKKPEETATATTPEEKTKPDQEPKKPKTINIVGIFCKECHMWHSEGPCDRSKCISFPPSCKEDCKKRMCCDGCGGSGCKSCSGHGGISCNCGNCSSKPCKGCNSHSCSGCSSGSWSCKGCGSSSCSGCSSWSWSCKGCGSSSCSGCSSCTGSCKGCGSSSCNGRSCGGYSNWGCKGCGSISCSGGCNGWSCSGYSYNSWSCKRCGSSSCSGCSGNSCKRCGNFWCSGCGGGSCSCGRCSSCSATSTCTIM